MADTITRFELIDADEGGLVYVCEGCSVELAYEKGTLKAFLKAKEQVNPVEGLFSRLFRSTRRKTPC